MSLHEIFVFENIRRRADDAETHAVLADIAERKSITPDENGLVRGAMRVVMDDFVDSGFGDSRTR